MDKKRYQCKVCGYIHEGASPPDFCPVCKMPSSEFEFITEVITDSSTKKRKGLNRDSNLYTLIYSVVMVAIVAVMLAYTSESLKDIQKKNADIDKMMQILRAVKVETTAKTAETKYRELITDAFLVKADGMIEKRDAFNEDIVKAYTNHTALPVFVASIDGQTKYIMALYGSGLWGAVWGYVAVNDDKDTIFGADFSHEGETPGLGAEIAEPSFRLRFNGKHLFQQGEFMSVAVVKPGRKAQGQDYVDGISGGTITSDGVHKMLRNSLERYVEFLKTAN